MKEMMILKKYITASKDLSEPVHYFFDLMDQDKLLEAVGSRMVKDINHDKDLSIAMHAAIDVIGKFLNEKINVSSQIFTEIPQEKFFHGYCTISGHPEPFLVLYCADLQVGIAALADSNGRTNFFRFFLAKNEDLKNKH